MFFRVSSESVAIFVENADCMKILVVEDERQLREVVRESLQKDRFVVETAADVSSAIGKLEAYSYDCVLLDIMLPDGNGLDILRKIKDEGRGESVIIISAKDAIDDKISGLDLGADDYLAKPFHLAELSARIRSVARRRNHGGDTTVRIGNLEIRPDTREVSAAGRLLDLSRKEYDILEYFVNRRGRLINKLTLAESVWGDHIDMADNFDFIYAHIKNLRKKLNDAGVGVEIKSVYGLGYKMEEQAEK